MRIDIKTAVKMGVVGQVEVRLNGLTLKGVVRADEDKGEVTILDYDSLESGMDYFPTKTMHGEVRIFLGGRER